MIRTLAIAALLALSACGSTQPVTPASSLLAAEGSYSGMLAVAANYNELRRCAPGVPATLAAPCSDARVVEQLRKADASVRAAETVAERLVLDTPKADVSKAMVALRAAIAVVQDILEKYGSK